MTLSHRNPSGKTVMDPAVREENRRIRYLRILVDLSLQSIMRGELTIEQALKTVEDAKKVACRLFPGSEEAFELIYRPRFERVIRESYGWVSEIA